MWEIQQEWLHEQGDLNVLLGKGFEPYAAVVLHDADGDEQTLVLLRRFRQAASA